MNVLLIACLFLLAYPLFIYPPLLALLSRTGRKRTIEARTADPFTPAVSVLLSVYNEEAALPEKLRNFAGLDYPADCLEFLVVSDGSTDGTDDLVRRPASHPNARNVRLLRQEGRAGKTAALNLAAAQARGEILVFTDADALFAPDSLRRLIEPFRDPAVGLTSGRSIYLDAAGRESAGSFYRRFEEWLKEKEGRLFGIAGADGAIYALRADLYASLPPAYINDFIHPFQTALAGRRSLAVPAARAIEPAPEAGAAAELARQTRIMAQSWRICLDFCGALLRARRFGFFWQIVSHKILRWIALPLLVLVALLSLLSALFQTGILAALSLAGCVVFALAAGLGAFDLGGLLGRAAWLFLIQAAAAMSGLARLRRGEAFITWRPRGN